MATFYASKTGEVSAREKEHSALVRELAGECMTLLENDGKNGKKRSLKRKKQKKNVKQQRHRQREKVEA